jgi:hypothetical protein
MMADAPSRRLLGAVLERSLRRPAPHRPPRGEPGVEPHPHRPGAGGLPSGWQAALSCHSSEEIGGRLFISVNTVKSHTRSIFERLGMHNRMAAARVLGAGR